MRLWLLVALVACVRAPTEVTVLAAASLGATLDALEPELAIEHPGVDWRVELSASRIACTKVSDQGREADLVISADHHLITELLRPEHADFSLVFAANTLVLAYPANSRIAPELDAGAPWQTVLASEQSRVGIANPKTAPVGFRALRALALNDETETDPRLRTGAAIAARIRPEHQRPDVTKLLAPLETGEIDAAFIYRSEARLHGLRFVELSRAIDGSGDAFYALTIPNKSREPELAAALVRLLLSPRGRSLAAERHLELLAPNAIVVDGTPPVPLP